LLTPRVQARERSEDFIFADDDEAEPVWEHEARFKGTPMTREHTQIAGNAVQFGTCMPCA
jgi:hypothetical protein